MSCRLQGPSRTLPDTRRGVDRALKTFFGELRRRNVVRVAAAYLVTAWLVLQVADVVLEAIEAPAWAMKGVLLLLLYGAAARARRRLGVRDNARASPKIVKRMVLRLPPDSLQSYAASLVTPGTAS